MLITSFWAVDFSLRPYIFKLIIDHLGEDVVFSYAVYYIFLSVALTACFRFWDWLWLCFNPGVKKEAGMLLMSRLFRQEQKLFEDNFSGGLANQIKEVMSSVPDVVRILINDFYGHILALILAIYTAYNVHPFFALGLFLWATTYVLGTLLCFTSIEGLSQDFSKNRAKSIGLIVDMLSNILNIRLFCAQKNEMNTLNNSLNKYYNSDQKLQKFLLKMHIFQGLSFATYQSLSVCGLIYAYNLGITSKGDFALLLSINVHLIDCLWNLSKDLGDFAEKSGNIKQALSIILKPIEIKDNKEVKVISNIKGEITFQDVGFHYKKNKPLFHNLNIKIEPGQKTGLVGYSGGGKSTFSSLILRLYDISEGKILLDGIDIRDLAQDFLHNNIGLIPQNPSLFHRKIYDNIAFVRPNASKKEVIEAAKKAHAHEFIESLVDGYDSEVGERGVKLSGGQRQRIAIARIFLKDPPILILDEATSQLDSHNEELIQEALKKLMFNKTTLVIAHRLSTIKGMDRILVFHQGKIAEDGDHRTLLSLNGIYTHLYKTQVGGFLQDDTEV